MLDQKQIRVIFLFKFKMGHKASETTHNINKAFGLGTANECTVQWWFKKFWKGGKSLEDEECNDWPSEVDSDQLGESSKLILLQLHKKFPKNLILTVYGYSAFETNWKGVKAWCIMRWLQKNCHFEESFSLILWNNNGPFLNQIVTYNEKWTL